MCKAPVRLSPSTNQHPGCFLFYTMKSAREVKWRRGLCELKGGAYLRLYFPHKVAADMKSKFSQYTYTHYNRGNA